MADTGMEQPEMLRENYPESRMKFNSLVDPQKITQTK